VGAGLLTGTVDFICVHRDRPGSADLRDELLEDHWAYMDGYADTMIARGPMFAPDADLTADDADNAVATGSVHILDLPDAPAARMFAFDEPNYQAGVYRDVLLRRWRNLLGRSMWQYPGGPDGGRRFLVLGLGVVPVGAATDALPSLGEGHDLIAYGPILSDDGQSWLGTAALVRAADAPSALAVLEPGRYDGVEVHAWTFGGRR
jgi:uncharacterized protein YciI